MEAVGTKDSSSPVESQRCIPMSPENSDFRRRMDLEVDLGTGEVLVPSLPSERVGLNLEGGVTENMGIADGRFLGLV